MKPETHIPVPTSRRGGGHPVYVQHLRKLDVGESMFFPDEEFSADIEQIGIGIRVAAAREWGNGNFITRTVKEGKPLVLGVRVWRTG